MSSFRWQANNKDECWDLLEVQGIVTEETTEDAVVAKVYDMEEFIRFCNPPKFPNPTGEDRKDG